MSKIARVTKPRSPAPTGTQRLKAGEPHWRDLPHHTMQAAGCISGISPASLYRFASEGRLLLKRLAGRTLVDTKSLIALVDSAEDWKPSSRTARAVEKRVKRARAAWQD
jgi:hypothetical protein